MFDMLFAKSLSGGGGGSGSGLPAVTSDDNGSLLGVSNGAWAKVSPEIMYVPFTVTENQGTYTATTTATFADASAAVLEGKQLVARCTGITSNGITLIPCTTYNADGSNLFFNLVLYTSQAPVHVWAQWDTTGITTIVRPLAVQT